MILSKVYEDAERRLERNEITLGEFERLVDIEVIEPKRGEWVDDDEHAEYYWANCSVCGLQIDVHENRGYHNYCPNCGARMKGADDE